MIAMVVISPQVDCLPRARSMQTEAGVWMSVWYTLFPYLQTQVQNYLRSYADSEGM
uniref:Uncharacterized protein n=1 Tax=Magnetococcus massalia (strain MO-1) TaxID=451514 RepID=A0A1S7LL14_MAGMO|nr:protein of unknown function [Candidatus Magnetococcus massalia]